MQLILPLTAAGGLLAGLVALGHRLGDRLNLRRERTTAFLDIDCTPPTGVPRQAFLEEAQYLTGQPDRLDLQAPDAANRVRVALAAHPWVAEVKEVRVLPAGRVRAELTYRVPVLAVARPSRLVDSQGILLPRAARSADLPVLRSAVQPPQKGPGQPWGDVRVVAAAQVAALLRPHLSRMGLSGCGVEVHLGEVTLLAPARRLIWGSPPGLERTGEAGAELKLQRLPEAAALAGREIDLRPIAGPRSQVLRR